MTITGFHSGWRNGAGYPCSHEASKQAMYWQTPIVAGFQVAHGQNPRQ
jgi:hypothetical protein